MSHVLDSQSNQPNQRSLFLFGVYDAQPWNRDRLIKESREAGLRVVLAKIQSDNSDAILAERDQGSSVSSKPRPVPHATEVLPDEASAIRDDLLTHYRQEYGADWCVLPLSDYATEYAATISTLYSDPCYPPRSAEIVKRKHQLRDIWNRLARQPDSGLYPVEYCYAELRAGGKQFDCYPSAGFDALPEETPLIVKPDELSSSIEVHFAASKTEAIRSARDVCAQLRAKWYEVGQSIGVEVRPRVVMEMAIERSTALHPGAEFSIEFVTFDGRHYPVGITQKWIGPNFIETGQLFPAESLPERLKPVLERAMQQVLDELRVSYCVSHWEFIITPDERIALVEGHLRPAGDQIMALIEHSTGRSPTAALCEALSRRKVDFSFVPRMSCGIFWMVPQIPLAEVTHIEVERAVTEALCEDLYIDDPGIIATPNWSYAADWMKRFAHVMSTGRNLDFIKRCCRDVAQSVTLFGTGNDSHASTPLKLAIDE
jgi:ATP-grasp domain-containing protein